jgi:hypothetical protein
MQTTYIGFREDGVGGSKRSGPTTIASIVAYFLEIVQRAEFQILGDDGFGGRTTHFALGMGNHGLGSWSFACGLAVRVWWMMELRLAKLVWRQSVFVDGSKM